MPDREWISIPELAEHLGVPVRTIRSWRARGEGPTGVVFGRAVRFHRKDVDAWIQQQRDAAA